jgi:predicted regulator of Ras-like GTPase activity (Roadblock/LC7/MglB family)
MDQTELEEIFSTSPLVEAVIQVSKDGLPLAWRCRSDISVEETASLVSGLFSLGFELDLVPDKKSAQLSIDTDHGTMLMQTMPDNSVMLVLTSRGGPIKEIEIKLAYAFHQNPVTKEVQHGKNC